MDKHIVVILISLVGSFGCGVKTVDSGLSIDPVLLPYFNQFAHEAEIRNKNLNIAKGYALNLYFGSVSTGQGGRCGIHKDTTDKFPLKETSEIRTIIIDRTNWETLNEENKLSLVMHELGHCILGKQHDDRIVKSQQNPDVLVHNSFMHSTAVQNLPKEVWYYELQRLSDELFN